jgi:hypothetical protein
LDSRLILPVNTILDNSYRILRVVGSGGFGITYEAEDINLGTLVAVKEYYPFDFGDRDASMSVRPKSERHKPTFERGRSSFLEEARTLARFEHPSIVRVIRVFVWHSNAYMVMRFEHGLSVEAWLSGLGRPPTQQELDAVTAPLLDALEMMHAANFLHRDIAPDNIIVRADGTPVLLDFGAARRTIAEMSHSLTGIVKAGYSPHEQYATDGRQQGPWSDLYALGGTLYRAVTGRPPEEATLRVDDDGMPSAAKAAKGKYRPGFLAAIDACLEVRHSERPRSVGQLRPMLLGPVARSRREAERPAEPRNGQIGLQPTVRVARPARQWPSARQCLTAAAAVLVLFGGVYSGLKYAGPLPTAAQRQAALELEKAKARDEQMRQWAEEARIAEEVKRRRAEAEEEARRIAEEKKRRIAALEEERRQADEAEEHRIALLDLQRRQAEGAKAWQRKVEERRIAALAKEDAERKSQADRIRKSQEARISSEQPVRSVRPGKATPPSPGRSRSPPPEASHGDPGSALNGATGFGH